MKSEHVQPIDELYILRLTNVTCMVTCESVCLCLITVIVMSSSNLGLYLVKFQYEVLKDQIYIIKLFLPLLQEIEPDICLKDKYKVVFCESSNYHIFLSRCGIEG